MNQQMLEKARKEFESVKANGSKLTKLEALLLKWQKELEKSLEIDDLKLLEEMLEETRKAKKLDRWLNLFVVIGMLLALAFMCWLAVYWQTGIRIDESAAQVLIQEFVDQSPEFSGQVEEVQLGAELCSQVTGGNSCQVQVTFSLEGKYNTAMCVYGLRKVRRCYIE